MMASTSQEKKIPEKKQWFGPFVEDFTYVGVQADVVKYHCMLNKQDFEFLVPRTMFSWGPEKLPANLRVAVAPSAETVLAYFERVRKNHPEQTLKASDCTTYTFADEKQKLRRYTGGEGASSILFVPREVFSGKQEPDIIHVAIAELS